MTDIEGGYDVDKERQDNAAYDIMNALLALKNQFVGGGKGKGEKAEGSEGNEHVLGIDPAEVLKAAGEAQKLTLLKAKALEVVRAINPTFKEPKDVDAFKGFRADFEDRMTNAKTLKELYDIINELEAALQQINATKKFMVGGEQIKIGKTENVGSGGLGMKEYKDVPAYEIAYKITVNKGSDPQLKTLKGVVETKENALKTKVDTYKVESDKLATLRMEMLGLEGSLLTAENEESLVTAELGAKKDDVLTRTGEREEIERRQQVAQQKVKNLGDEISKKQGLIDAQVANLAKISGEAKAVQAELAQALNAVTNYQLGVQKEVVTGLTTKIEYDGSCITEEVDGIGKRWGDLMLQIQLLQNEVSAFNFSLADHDRSSAEFAHIREVEKQILDKQQQLAMEMDSWIVTYAQQGVNVQAYYDVHKQTANVIVGNLEANQGNLERQRDQLRLAAKDVEDKINKLTGSIKQAGDENPSLVEKQLANQAELVAQKEEIEKLIAYFDDEIVAVKNEIVRRRAQATYASTAIDYTAKVTEMRARQFDKDRNSQDVEREKAYRQSLKEQKDKNTEAQKEKLGEKGGLEKQLSELEPKYKTAKEAWEKTSGDGALIKAYQELVTQRKSLTGRIAVLQKMVDMYATLNTKIDAAMKASETEEKRLSQEIGQLTTDLAGLQRDLAKMDLKSAGIDVPDPVKFVGGHLVEGNPFVKKVEDKK